VNEMVMTGEVKQAFLPVWPVSVTSYPVSAE